jgi:hypothetical protein
MKIQVVNAYIKLAESGRAPVILCGRDKDHTHPIAGLDPTGAVVLECLGCEWKRVVGQRDYESMKNVLVLDDPDWFDYF